MNLIRSIINFFGFNDAIVDGIGERGMRDSSIIRYNEVHDMYDKIIKDLGDMSAYVSKGYIYDKIKERTGLSTRHISRILNHTRRKILDSSNRNKKERLYKPLLFFIVNKIHSLDHPHNKHKLQMISRSWLL